MSSPIGRRTLRRRTFQLFTALATLFVVSAAGVLLALIDFRSKGNVVIDRWQPAYATSIQMLADLVDQETGVRGYALGRREQFLEPYRQFRTQERLDEASLRSLIGDRPPVQASLAEFVGQADRWRAQVAVPFIARVRAGDAQVGSEIVGLRAKRQFDALRVAGTAVSAQVAGLTWSARAERLRALDLVWVAGSLGGLLVLVTLALVWRGLHRFVLLPVERLAVQTRTVATGVIERPIRPSGPAEVFGLGLDVEQMRARIATELLRVERARQVLVARGEELMRSNADLEQFAYVASHDLSEPLRKVSNFCQLLERQYADQLDDKAKQYIAFAVDGAKRMQVLITDLLAFSRVGRSSEDFVPIELGAALDRALMHLDERVTASGAVIERLTALPRVEGDLSLLAALFQNLVGNALKYRDPERAPLVRISAERYRPNGDPAGGDSANGDPASGDPANGDPAAAVLEPVVWLVTVHDNGIGIEAQYAERIFTIFQRLHLRDAYGGTGIGLALCRRIVEFHGGRIWLDPGGAPGARFHFTIPERRDRTDRSDV